MGSPSPRTHVNSVEQKMSQGKEWLSFFNNIENKTDLLKILVTYVKLDEVKAHLSVPFVVNEGNVTWKILDNSVTVIHM